MNKCKSSFFAHDHFHSIFIHLFFFLFIFVNSIFVIIRMKWKFSRWEIYMLPKVKKMIIIHISFYINVHRRNGTFRKRRSVWFYLMKWYHSELRYYNNETKLNDIVQRRSKLLIGKREFVISIYVNPDILIPFFYDRMEGILWFFNLIFLYYVVIILKNSRSKNFLFEMPW